MNVTLPHRTGTTRQAATAAQRKESTRASKSSLRLPGVTTSSTRPSLTSLGSSKALALQKREQRDAEVVLEESIQYLCGASAQETLDAIIKAVTIRRRGTITMRKSGKPLWQRIQYIVAISNQEAIRRVQAAIPPDEIRFYFDSILNIVEMPPKKPIVGIVDEFEDFPSLRKYLIGATLNNKAFLQYAAGDAPNLIAQTLLRALKIQGVAFSTITLYNLAVIMVASKRFDQAMEYIACCSEIIELCLKMVSSESRGASSIFTEFKTNVAKHAIMCHHLIASLAAWSGIPDLEIYHCQLAVCCAKKYLEIENPVALRCARRLAAAKANEFHTSTLNIIADEPPRAPMLTDDMIFVNHPLFVVFMREAEALRPPPGFSRRLAGVENNNNNNNTNTNNTNTSRSPDLTQPGRLPKIKEKHARRVSAQPRRSVTPNKGRRLTEKLLPLPSIGAVLKELRKERPETPPQIIQQQLQSESVYSVYSPHRHESPSLITFVPKPAYYCYKHLRKEMRQLMGALEEEYMTHIVEDNANVTTPEIIPVSNNNESSHRISFKDISINETQPASPIPKDYMLIMDKKLRQISRLVPDKNFEKFEFAIIKLQSQWRGIVARRECRQLPLTVAEAIKKREAAEIIQYAYRNHLATRDDIQEKKKLREHRALVMRITLIQRYLYEKQSIEEWGTRCVISYKRLLAEIIEKKRRYNAAICIQKIWRMCLVRLHMNYLLKSTIHIQSLWRGYKGRIKAREVRTYRRLEEQKRLAELTIRIRPIQIWWKKVIAVRAGKAIVLKKQNNITKYLEEQELLFNKEWERIKHVPNVELCVIKVLSVLRGFHTRIKCRYQYKMMHILRRFFLRIIWKKREQQKLKSLRETQEKTRALHRRREEVTDAAIRIQCLVRCWFAKKERRELYLQWQWLHQKASIIQRAYRRYIGKQILQEAREALQRSREEKEMSQLLYYSASKIQATWRMYREWKANVNYLKFLRFDRHEYATRIQKAWFAYKAREEINWLRQKRKQMEYFIQKEQYELLAIIRIQSVIRMFLIRNKLLKENIVISLWPTPAKRHRSARIIQSLWRRYAAYEYVQQLRFSRAYYDQQKINMESIHTFATIIQSLVRAKIINPKLVEARRIEIENDNAEHKKKRADLMRETYAAITIQKNMRNAIKRIHTSNENVLEEKRKDNNNNNNNDNSINISSNNDEELKSIQAEAEANIRFIQRCGRGAMARRDLYFEFLIFYYSLLEEEELNNRRKIIMTWRETSNAIISRATHCLISMQVSEENEKINVTSNVSTSLSTHTKEEEYETEEEIDEIEEEEEEIIIKEERVFKQTIVKEITVQRRQSLAMSNAELESVEEKEVIMEHSAIVEDTTSENKDSLIMSNIEQEEEEEEESLEEKEVIIDHTTAIVKETISENKDSLAMSNTEDQEKKEKEEKEVIIQNTPVKEIIVQRRQSLVMSNAELESVEEKEVIMEQILLEDSTTTAKNKEFQVINKKEEEKVITQESTTVVVKDTTSPESKESPVISDTEEQEEESLEVKEKEVLTQHTIVKETTTTTTTTSTTTTTTIENKKPRVISESLIKLLQRCGRGCLERQAAFLQLKMHPRWLAAVTVQRIWRGYCARQLIDVYYEFYMEEVEDDEEEKVGEGEEL